MKYCATLKELPKLIQTGVPIEVSQRSLPLTVGETILNSSTKVITALLGNKRMPTYDIYKVRHHGLNEIAELAGKINYLYEPIKKIGTRSKVGLSRVKI